MVKFIKLLFLFSFLFFMTSLPGISEETYNNLSYINVTGNGVDFKVTLGFKEKFSESAFLQKQEDGYFHIFIPDTVYDKQKLKINYRLSKKYYKPQFDIEQRNYIKNNSKSRYVRLDMFTDEDASVEVVTENIKSKITGNIIKSVLFAFMFLFFFGVFYFLKNVLPNILFNKRYNTFVPESFSESSTGRYKTYKRSIKQQPIKESLFDSVLSSGMSDFSCFNVKDKTTGIDKNVEIESTISKAKDLSLSSDTQTNPLLMNINLSEVEETPEETVEVETDIEEKDELISLLNVTPTKGFVLKRLKGEFQLFSFNGAFQKPLKSFSTLNDLNLHARFFDKNKQNDIYVLSVGEYKSMVEFSSNDIKELMVL